MFAANFVGAFPPFVRAPLFAVLFAWFCTALGYRLLRSFRVPLANATASERGLIYLALGAGFLQYLPYCLGLAHELNVHALRLSCALLALLLSKDAVHVARRFRNELKNDGRLTRSMLIWGALFVALFGLLLTRALIVGNMGDDDGYHLTAPKRWLASGTVGYLASYTNTNASMGFEMLYAIGLAVCDPVGAKFLHFSAGLFALFAVVLSAKRIAGVWAGLCAVSLLLIATPICNVPYLFGQAYVDFGAAWMASVTVLIWLIWREQPDQKLLACMALCAGFAASFKITALLVCVVWLPVVLVELRQRGVAWPNVLKQGLAFGILAFTQVLPWLFRGWRLTGNPVYPMFASYIPTRDWTPEHGRVFSRYTQLHSWAISAGPSLSDFQRRAILGVADVVVLVGTLLVLWRLKQPALRALVACGALFILISVPSTGMIPRYWLPGLMWWTLVAAALLSKRWPTAKVQGTLAIAALALALALQIRTQIKGDHTKLTLAGNTRIAAGLSTFEREYPDDALPVMWRYINDNTPADARVLLASFYSGFGESSFGGFWLDRLCFATDSHLQTAIPFNNFESFVKKIQQLGIEYVVLPDHLFSPGRQGFSFPAGENEYPFCVNLVEKYGQQLQHFGHLQLYRLNWTFSSTPVAPANVGP